MTQQYLRKASRVIGLGQQALDLSEMQFLFDVAPATLHLPKVVQLTDRGIQRHALRWCKGFKLSEVIHD